MANANINTQQSGTILLTINSTDTENLDIHEWTKRENIGGFNWCLKAERNQLNGEPKMDLFIICNEDCTDKLWLAKVNISIEVKQKNRCPRRISTDGCYFHNGSVFELSDVFFNWNRVEDTVLKVELHVLRSNSKHRLMALDTDLRLFYASEAENEQRDEEGVIAVNKHALASISGYFQNLFFGNWSERRSTAADGTDSFTINEDAGFDLHAFSTMIYASMAMGWMVHDSKMFPSMVQDPPDPKNLNDRMAMKILKLSVKYDIPMMMDYSEKYLISQLEKSNFPKIELLEEAEQLGLQELKEHSLKSISPLDIADNFVRNAEILSRLGRRTQEELDNHLKERARKMRIEFQLNHIPLSHNAPSSTSNRRRNNMNDPRVNQSRDVGFDLDWQPQ